LLLNNIVSYFRDWALSILGSRFWPSTVTWRHRSRDHSTRHRLLPIDGPLEPSLYGSISNDLRDIQRRMWRNSWHNCNYWYR